MISLPGPLKKVPPIAWVAIVGVVMVVLYLKSKGSATTASTAGTIVPSSGNGSAPIDPNAPATQVTLSSTDMATLLAAQKAQEADWLTSLLASLGSGGGITGTPITVTPPHTTPVTTGAPGTALQNFVASLSPHQLHLYNKGLPGLQATLTAHQLHLQHLSNIAPHLATITTVPKVTAVVAPAAHSVGAHDRPGIRNMFTVSATGLHLPVALPTAQRIKVA